MSASQDGSESVDQFLARIASIKEGRDQASEERNRRMEEDFLKNRKERQARRLERARSLSPSKTGPSASGSSLQNSSISRDAALNPPIDFSPRAATLSRSNAVSARTSPKLEPEAPESNTSDVTATKPLQLNSAAGLSRSGTLSWQQRPARDGGFSRPRPLSSIETIRQIPKDTNQQSMNEDRAEPTRQDIAAALGAKDPSWFRQTQERGQGSAAFRKNQVEDASVVEHATRSQILPGMSRRDPQTASLSTHLPDNPRARSQERETTPIAVSQAQRAASPGTETANDTPKLDLSLPQAKQLDARPTTDMDPGNRSGGILSGRSPSPTKGLGGFVESAMMKRSDSVSKRWSVQANAGLKRGDSIAGARPLSGVRTMPPASLSKHSVRDGSPSSPVTVSRPGSKQGDRQGLSQSATPERRTDAGESKSQAASIETAPRPKTPPQENELARSPSKSTDSRRWSPTKSSWLESALMSTPDPPKLQPSREEVPAWKVALQRNKASRDLSPDKSSAVGAETRDNETSGTSKLVQPPIIGRKPDLEQAALSKPKFSKIEAMRPEPESADLDKKKQPLGTLSPTLTAPEANGAEAAVADASDSTSSKIVTDTTSDQPDSKLAEVKAEKSPPAIKPKPQTPPKHDFRSSLRSRAPTSGEGNTSEPEFKSVFGKLKRAQTQNYVAPDVLKNNILQGKAALNITGGPQKTQRVDEFKESILQKKEAMKASAVQKKENSVQDPKPAKSESAVPEALARRKTLHRATPSVTKLQNTGLTPAQAAQEQLKTVTKPAISPKPTLTGSQMINPPMSPTKSPDPAAKTRTVDSPTGNSQGLDIPTQSTASVIESVAATAPPTSTSRVSATPDTKKSVSLPKAELPVGSKLASRLNPNLASLLSRGNSPRPSPSGTPPLEESIDATKKSTTSRQAIEDPSTSGELTHMTKGRARGPKRRAPKSHPTQTKPPTQSRPANNTFSASLINKPTAKKAAEIPMAMNAGFISNTPAHPQPTKVNSEVRASEQETKIQDVEPRQKVKPTVASKSPELRRVSSSLSASQTDGIVPKRVDAGRFDIAADKDTTTSTDRQPVAPEKPQMPKPDSNLLPLTPSKSRINSSKPAQQSADLPPKPQSPKPATGLGLIAKPSAQPQSGPAPLQSKATSERGPKYPPSSKEGLNSDGVANSRKLLSTYLSTPVEGQRRMEFDASELLSVAPESAEKVKVVSHTIWEIGSGGKKTAMPSQQEHILFEESMYLLIHTFQNEAGNKISEAHLWCGDSVPGAAIEDVQLFARKDARDYNAKLEVVKQGKESARFFQALGGILIVRRSKASSMYMLCGRRHLGHITFDEVEITAANLCSGFAYLISAKFGKLYLWKGKGSGADEVGCARLIGMDLGLTGEIEEISEGQEPSSFWESFSQTSRDTSLSNDWQQRADHKCYPTSLYRVEVDTPKATGGFWGLRAASPPKATNKAAVELVSPFSHRDLDPANVYVLDTYRSIFVLLGAQASDKVLEFVTAVHLAQDLAMLSPSIQDRSLLPACLIAFGEPTPDIKMCFRKWPSSTPSGKSKPSACVGLEHVMQAMTL